MGKLKNLATWKKTLLFILTIIILFIGGSFFYINNLLNKVTKVDIKKENLSVNEEVSKKLDENNEIRNIALFGIDSPEGKNGRSDSIMILTIDEKNDELKLSSIMRDSYVNIPGHGKDKITHAYAFGGPELAISTLNKNFNLNIEDFITVNLSTLPKIIDSIGGINLEITNGDLKYLNNYIDGNSSNIKTPGNHHLDGVQATAYARIRYDGGDQGRTQRHRNIINGIFEKMLSISPTKYPSILNDTLPLVQTNISSSEFIPIGTDILSLGTSDILEYRVPCDKHSKGINLNNIYYMNFNIEDEIKELHNFIYK
ncbi:LCP family protein [Clostridium sp. Ade.TY]|uniref:LCP family protein n=1 Tax=Clostridium sp. Ade.TY TaxID=1391647 RepID=UPI00041C1CD7|nr:LCP family protein [Clostridium sp. Ade.TY]